MIPVLLIRYIHWYSCFYYFILSVWPPVVFLPCHIICPDSHHVVYTVLYCFYLINSRLWYKGTPKYLRESVTGLEIRIQNWQDSSCIADAAVRINGGNANRCAGGLVWLYCACTRFFPLEKGSRWSWHHLVTSLLSAKTSGTWTESRDICALAIQRTFLTQEEVVLALTGLCCLLLPKNREVQHNPPGFFLKGSVCCVANKPSNKIQGKH